MEEEVRYPLVEKQNLLREFVFILFDRRKVVFTIFIIVFLISLAAAFLLPSVYRSYAKFALTVPQQLDPLQRETFFDYRNRVRRSLQEQKEIILSNRVLQKVVEKQNPQAKPEEMSELIEDLLEYLKVTPPGGETFEDSSVFYVSYDDKDPEQAQKVTQYVANAYLLTYEELYRTRSDYSYDFFRSQTQGLYDEMLNKEKKLRDYESAQALALIEILNLEPNKPNLEVGPNALLTQFLRKYHELQEELAGVNVAIDALEKEASSGKIPAVPSEMEAPGRSITLYKNKVAQLQLMMNEMKSQFTGEFTPLKQAEKEMKLTLSSMKEELERTVRAQKVNAESIAARIQELEKVIHYLRERIKATAQERSNYEHLQQEFNLAKEAYVYARNQMEQARLASALNQSKQFLTFVDEPVVPIKPFKPNRLLIIVLGFLSGLFLGIATAVSLDYFDHTIKKPQDIERFLKVPSLGSVPRVG